MNLENEYKNNETFRTTADNLTNGICDVAELTESERQIHFEQAWEIYCDEVVLCEFN